MTVDPIVVKLASAVVHAEELLQPGGHPADLAAFRSILSDPDVVRVLDELRALALLPVKR